MTGSPLHILVAGYGSIGRRHCANLAQVAPQARVTVLRRPSSEGEAAYPVVHSLEEALAARPDAAVIATPAALHMEAACALARLGVHLFIEKPLSHDLDRVEELAAICRQQGVVAQVGYNFRYYEPFLAVKQALDQGLLGRVYGVLADAGQYLPDWRPQADYRTTASASTGLGGGVVLELSHELDYLRWFFGEAREITARTARVSGLDLDVEDTADAIILFEGGVTATLHVDMVSRPAWRSFRIHGEKGSISWNMQDQGAFLHGPGGEGPQPLFPPGPVDRNAMYRDELKDFLERAALGQAARVTVEDGARTLALALALKRSAREKRTVSV